MVRRSLDHLVTPHKSHWSTSVHDLHAKWIRWTGRCQYSGDLGKLYALQIGGKPYKHSGAFHNSKLFRVSVARDLPENPIENRRQMVASCTSHPKKGNMTIGRSLCILDTKEDCFGPYSKWPKVACHISLGPRAGPGWASNPCCSSLMIHLGWGAGCQTLASSSPAAWPPLPHITPTAEGKGLSSFDSHNPAMR